MTVRNLLQRIEQLSPRKRALLATRNPLSFGQQRLWFLDQLAGGSPVFNLPRALRLEGDLDLPVLRRCLTEIVRRHEVLRTVFPTSDGQPFQAVHPPAEVAIPVID